MRYAKSSRKTENLTVINTENKIKRYNNIAEIFFEYVMFMLEIYKKRKQYILDKLITESLKDKEKIRFIQDVNSEVIVLKNKKTTEVIDKLIELKYQKIEDSYDYLLGLKIQNLTHDKIEDLKSKIQEASARITEIENTAVSKMWLNDIIEFEKLYKKGE